MLDLIAQWSQQPNLLLYICVAGAVMLAVETIGLSLRRIRSSRTTINKRLQLLGEDTNQGNVLVQLRRDRGLTEDGSFSFSFVLVNRLLVQSGVGTQSISFIVVVCTCIAIGALAGFLVFRSPIVAVPSGLLAGVAMPLMFLAFKCKRRRAKFSEQLPEALDIMVRSMRAGHPVSVAVTLVARELSDPIGTEFGMVADEMTYGLDLEAALQNMCMRVGQQDLPFVLVAISIQSRTGGNLAEVLSNLSRVIRDRFKLRRRVKAMSAEGRMSAGALSLIPLLVFLAVNLLAPGFYGDIKHDPLIPPVATITFLIWAMGICIIYRLVNFKY
ncbi:MAG: type II secretion system F family protein [Alphaproteobacteria bacterium]|jgi:tight adherence protein B|nr:MAG: type II secretion system F family protein [Alphaproteobacteria bacterium]